MEGADPSLVRAVIRTRAYIPYISAVGNNFRGFGELRSIIMDIKIVGPLFPETYLDNEGKEHTRGFYSFTVDGVPCLKWWPECRVEGMPKDYYAQRCIDRLKAGRSDVLGKGAGVAAGGTGATVMSGGIGQRATIATVEVVKKPGTATVTYDRPRFRFILDGKESTETYPTEGLARGAAAIAGFMTRDKLGAIPDTLAILKEQFSGQKCHVWVCPEEHEICATVDGQRYAISWARDSNGKFYAERFKKIGDGG